MRDKVKRTRRYNDISRFLFSSRTFYFTLHVYLLRIKTRSHEHTFVSLKYIFITMCTYACAFLPKKKKNARERIFSYMTFRQRYNALCIIFAERTSRIIFFRAYKIVSIYHFINLFNVDLSFASCCSSLITLWFEATLVPKVGRGGGQVWTYPGICL